ncbi:MAG: Clp1/GlmU family protein [Acidobacteriota bacterium]|nr:Clp1/GlmU family protein [Blastocatellia bacterium]MDW8238088.1 Clp1/GlmU family protein [Acidobacteriota bacterium]
MNVNHAEIDLPEAWQRAVDGLCAQPGCVTILGAVDTGKSTLTQVVIQAWQHAGLRIGWIDGDVGQSDLGPPTTLALQLIEPSTNLTTPLRPDAMRFVGSTSPAGHLLPVVVGLHRLAQLARERGAAALVINTSGMVFGGPARTLHAHLMDALKPDVVLALQRQSEVEHLLRPIERQRRCQVVRLPVSARASPRSREVRQQFRRQRFQAYLQGARLQSIAIAQVGVQNMFIQSGVPLSVTELGKASARLDTRIIYGERCADGLFLVADGYWHDDALASVPEQFEVPRVFIMPLSDFENRLIGLSDEQSDLLALGVLQAVDWPNKILYVLTPLDDRALPHVRLVQFGSLKLDPSSGVESPLGNARRSSASARFSTWTRASL